MVTFVYICPDMQGANNWWNKAYTELDIIDGQKALPFKITLGRGLWQREAAGSISYEKERRKQTKKERPE